MTGRIERWAIDAGRADIESACVHIARGMTAGTIAVERPDGDVIGGSGGDRNIGERRRHGRPVTAEAVGHALMGAGHRVQRVVSCCGVALRACSRGWNVIGRFAGARDIDCEGRGGRMTAAAIPGSWMAPVEGGRPRVTRGRPRARNHSLIRCRFMAGLTGGHRGSHCCVARYTQRGTVDAGRTDVEAAGIDVRRGVTAGAPAVEWADRNVVGRSGRDRDIGECSRYRRAVAAQAIGHALVRSGYRIQRVVACGRVALRTGGRRGDMVRRLPCGSHIQGKRRRRCMTAGAISGGGMGFVEGGRGP